MEHEAGLFQGTAYYYARYRPQYPPAFIAHLVERYGLDGHGRVLDLGCGTGQLLLPLAPHAQMVIGMDPDPEMLAEAQRCAAAAGVTNVEWLLGADRDLVRYADQVGPLQLTVMGRSFHWMESDATLRDLAALTVPGGGVMLGGEDCQTWKSTMDWQVTVRETIQHWLGTDRRAGGGAWSARVAPEPEPWSAVLARSPFSRFEKYDLPYVRTLDIDGVVGFLYSTSFASPAVLGDKQAGFEADLRERLAQLPNNDGFEEHLLLEAYLAWKPD